MLGYAPLDPSPYPAKDFKPQDSSSIRMQEEHYLATIQRKAMHPFQRHHLVAATTGPQGRSVEEGEGDDDLNFHDYIHTKHDDDKDSEYTRSAIASPLPRHALATDTTSSNECQPSNGFQSSSSQASQQVQVSHGTDAHMSSSDARHLYDSSSQHYPPFDLVPPPTQDLFRTLMEELQTQAALQRDKFMTPQARVDPTMANTDCAYSGQPLRTLPRFMMEPLDFLSANYESCLDHGLDSRNASAAGLASPPTSPSAQHHSYEGSFAHMGIIEGDRSATSTTSISSRSQGQTESETAGNSMGSSEPMSATNSKKRQMSEDSHRFDRNHGTSTPPSIPTEHDLLSPPTQDLFRMLMEELETQAAIQRDQDLASTAKHDDAGHEGNSSDYSFSSNIHQQHQNQQHQHTRLPRFVMDPFEFFMNSTSSHENQHTSSNSTMHTTVQSTTSPLVPSYEEQLAPPNQDLFRTLMEELEIQAALQRDQYLAETTGVAPRVDPEEYVFNGQHLRPLPRFMMEPLDFLTGRYESCLDGDMQGASGSGSHPFVASQTSLMDLDLTQPSSGARKPTHQSVSSSRLSRRASHTSKYKSILPQRPGALTITPSNTHLDSSSTGAESPLPTNPTKKRRLGAEAEALSSRSSSSSPSLSNHRTSTQEPQVGFRQKSPTSPTSMSALSASPTNQAADAESPEGSAECGNASAKRPWSPKDEALLLKLFAKRTPIKEIAQTLDRTVHSVRSRRQILTDPGFVKGKGHSVSRRSKQDPATTTRLPTYAQMAFLSLAWLPDLEGTLNDVATTVEKLFSRHLNRIPRTGHKNLQIWRAQISDALAHEKGQPRPRFESFGVKRGRQWVYRLTDFGKGLVEAMGGVETVCQDLLRSNEIELLAAATAAGSAEGSPDDGPASAGRDADGVLGGGSGPGAGIGQGQGYGYSYRPPDARQKSAKRSRPSRKSSARRKQAEASQQEGQGQADGVANASAISNAMEAMAAGLAKMMALEEERVAARRAD